MNNDDIYFKKFFLRDERFSKVGRRVVDVWGYICNIVFLSKTCCSKKYLM